jgi:hypothetical protein
MNIKQKKRSSHSRLASCGGNPKDKTKEYETILEVRTLLHCPEIDPYDNISLDQIT